MRTNDPALLGIILSPTWIAGLNRATDLLRIRHPGMPDGELLERVVVAGICSVIDTYCPRNEAPFGQVGQQIVGVLR